MGERAGPVEVSREDRAVAEPHVLDLLVLAVAALASPAEAAVDRDEVQRARRCRD
jgi:hypothetical protein